jgi:hypothetical protein
MKDLEQRQREMRKRNLRAKNKAAKPPTIRIETVQPEEEGDSELAALRRRVSVLERENAALRQEVLVLRQRSGRAEKSYDEQRREQQHNFFKYSNIRRY